MSQRHQGEQAAGRGKGQHHPPTADPLFKETSEPGMREAADSSHPRMALTLRPVDGERSRARNMSNGVDAVADADDACAIDDAREVYPMPMALDLVDGRQQHTIRVRLCPSVTNIHRAGRPSGAGKGDTHPRWHWLSGAELLAKEG